MSHTLSVNQVGLTLSMTTLASLMISVASGKSVLGTVFFIFLCKKQHVISLFPLSSSALPK